MRTILSVSLLCPLFRESAPATQLPKNKTDHRGNGNLQLSTWNTLETQFIDSKDCIYFCLSSTISTAISGLRDTKFFFYSLTDQIERLFIPPSIAYDLYSHTSLSGPNCYKQTNSYNFHLQLLFHLYFFERVVVIPLYYQKTGPERQIIGYEFKRRPKLEFVMFAMLAMDKKCIYLS